MVLAEGKEEEKAPEDEVEPYGGLPENDTKFADGFFSSQRRAKRKAIIDDMRGRI